MSQWEKLLARIHNNPKTVTFDELDNILQRAGYRRRVSVKESPPFGGDGHALDFLRDGGFQSGWQSRRPGQQVVPDGRVRPVPVG